MVLRNGDLLVGAHDLRVGKKLGAGGSGITYLARVQRPAQGSGVTRNQLVVIKTPQMKSTLNHEEILERLKDLFEKGSIEAGTKRSLRDVKCVAHVLDHGEYYKMLKNRRLSDESILIVVQEYVPGPRFDLFMKDSYGKGTGAFRGVPRAADFFLWTRKIVSAVRRVHQKQVVHGDIWHNNIIVRARTADPVLIDFGQAAFCAKGPGLGGRNQGSWMPPEGSGTISADMYSLGGLLLYLAAGDYDPRTERFPRIDNPDKLKTYVVDRIVKRNPALYRDNWGIGDIIARCLRLDPERRTRNTAALLRDVSLFDGQSPESNISKSLVSKVQAFQKQSTLIAAVVSGAISSLRDQLEDLRWGVLDLHEDVVVGMTQVVSLLSDGDVYLTVSTPRFWHTRNLGIQGRFLSANRQAILKNGATIKRLFLITRTDLTQDRELRSIIDAQLRIAADLRNAKAASPSRGGDYEVRFKPISDFERRQLIREGMNFGILIKGNARLLLFVGYDNDGVVGRIQFRTDRKLVASYSKKFDEMFRDENTFPLTAFDAWRDQRLADQRFGAKQQRGRHRRNGVKPK